MKFGGDFFNIMNFVIRLIRLIFDVFGDNEDKKVVEESEERTANKSKDEVC